ncbi:MAG: hypothetical protein NXI32_01375 [bacterium]|nr:hypothetical protein [bacterium]
MVSKSETFFQFPIKGLHLKIPISLVTPEEAKSRVNLIIDHCVMTAASSIWELSSDDRLKIEHLERAAKLLSVKYSSGPNYILRDPPKLPQQGGETLVRIRSDILWDVFHQRLPWKLFAVLCGVYAGIGTSRYKCLRMSYLNALSLGYSRPDQVPEIESGNLMSRFRMSRTVAALESRGLFVRASVDGRNYFYSHRISQAELDEAIVTRAVEKAKQRQKSKTDELRERVLAQLKGLE